MRPITFGAVKVIDSACTTIALVFTIARLSLRVRSRRIWWDDTFVLLSSLFLVLTCAAIALHYGEPYEYTLPTRLAVYYLIAEGFYATLWTARLSILFSVIRIIPDEMQKRYLYGTAIAFASVLVFLLAQVFWVCEAPTNHLWKTRPNPQCPLGRQVAVCQLITDIVSDALLIAVPTRLLARTNLESVVRFRLLIIFSAAILITVVSLVHASYILEVRGVDAIVSAIVEISVAICVSDLIVVVPALSRALDSRADEDPWRAGTTEPSFHASSFRFATSFLHFRRSSRHGASGTVSDSGTALGSGDTGTNTVVTATTSMETAMRERRGRDVDGEGRTEREREKDMMGTASKVCDG